MQFIKSISRILSSAIRPLKSVLDDLGAGVSSILEWPFRSPTKSREDDAETGIFFWLTRIALAIPMLVARLLVSPMELISNLWLKNWSNVLWTIPYIIGFCAFVTFAIMGFARSDARLKSLREDANVAFSAQNYQLAAKHYKSLIRYSPETKQSDQFKLSLSYSLLGETAKATKLLDELAPGKGDPSGYPEAHQLAAISIASKMTKPASPAVLETLFWHLSQSGESQLLELEKAWAEYYLATNDDVKALTHLKPAAKLQPGYLLKIADIYAAQGDQIRHAQALEEAKEVFQEILDSSPNSPTRIALSTIHYQLKDFELAEKVLADGLAIDATDSQLRNAAASFFMSRFQSENDTPFSNRFAYLQKALEHKPNHLPAYDAMIQNYRTLRPGTDRKQIVNALRESIAKDDSRALAHFALSNMLWVDKSYDEAQSEMQIAFEMDSSFSVIANNFAWQLAHAEEPDLDRALQLATQVIEANPKAGRFRDTLGTIMMKMGMFDQALAEFQKSLPYMPDKSKVHDKMAKIYQAIGNADLAQQHKDRAASN